MIFLGLGFCSSSKSIFLSPITEALNIKRSAFSLGESIRFIISAVANLFFGSIISRYGTKRLICCGFTSLMVASLLYALSNNLYSFYAAGVFFGIGFSFTSTTMVGCILVRWCKRNTGSIMGVVLAANGIGSAVATQLFTPFIYEKGNPFGYRKAFWITFGILFFVLVLFVLFYKEHPPAGEATETTSKSKKQKEFWDGIDFASAQKQPFFWLTLLCIFLTGLTLQGVCTSAAAHMRDVGIDAGYIATAVSILSIFLAFSKVLCGFMYDRFGLRVITLFCNVSSVVALTALSLLNDSDTGRLFAVVYAVFCSLALPLETIMLPIFAGSLFGLKSYNQILGFFSAACTAGYAVGIPLINLVYDICGTYVPAFTTLSFVMLLVLVAFQYIISKANSLKKG